MKVIPLLQLSDNYAYLIVDEETRKVGVVDCAEAASVLETVEAEGLDLTAILATHHHFDHVAGHGDLLAVQPELTVYGGEEQIPGLTTLVRDGDSISVGNLEGRAMLVPGHTKGHVAYYFPDDAVVFTGDTLFAGGCGRLFEGTPATMLKSLSSLRALPDETKVYFGHEYTETNLRFALTLEPGNEELKRKHEWVLEQNRKHKPTTPSTIGEEKRTNPFFRWESAEIRDTLRATSPDLQMNDLSVFAKTRALKDQF